MSLKLSVLITANANELKAASNEAKAAIAEIGTAAASAGSGLDKLQADLGDSAVAAAKVEAETSEAKTAIAGVGAAAAAAGSDLNQLQSGLNETAAAAVKVEAATRGAAAAQTDYRAVIERTIGIGQSAANSNSARAKELSDYGKALDDLRAKYNPLFAVQRQYLSTLNEIRAAEKVGALPAAEASAAIQTLDRSYLAQPAALTGMKESAAGAAAGVGKIGESAGAVKLTAQQMQGLGYQINDVATMLAMGASPFQVIASQAGQVIQVLGEGPGMRGSIAAIGTSIGSLITPTSAMAAGLLAVGAATVYFVSKSMALQPIDDVLKNQVDVVKQLRASYGLAGDAADDYGRRARGAIQSEANQQTRDSTTRLGQGVGEITSEFFSGRDNRVYRESSVYAPVQQAMEALIASAQKGPPNFIAFREKLSEIEKANPDKAGWWQAFSRGDLARAILETAKPFAELQRSIESTSNVAGELQRKLAAAALTRFDDASDKLKSLVPDGLSERDVIERSYNETRGRIAQLRGMKGDERDDLEAEALRQRNLALKEVERSENVIRDGKALDIREINARTTAERAAIAAERERGSLSGQVMAQSERDASIQHASDLVFAQDQRAAADALRDRQRARGDMVSSMQIEADSIGKTRGAAEAYRHEQELILQLYRDAEDTGRMVDPAEVQEIQNATRAAGALTDQIARLNAVRQQEEELRGLISRAGTIGGRDDAARRAEATYEAQRRIRERNEDPDSAYGRASVANAVKLSDFGDTIRRQAEAWDDWRSAGEDAIDSVVDALSSGTADIGDVLKGITSDFTKSFLQLAVSNPLKNALLGTSYGTVSDLFKKTVAPTLDDAGVKAFGTVAMSAAVVNINGSPLGLGSLGSNGGGSGAAGAINKLLNPANGNSAGASLGSNGLVPVSDVTAYIQKAATARGIDPTVALRVAKSEGLGEGIWQSQFTRNGYREPSYGPFQLLKGGKGTGFTTGMGNSFMQQTGLDPADPRNTFAGIDYALDGAAKNGWGAWYGAKAAGIGNRQGLAGAKPIGVDLASAEKSFDKINASAERMAASTDGTVSSFTSSATSLASGLGGTFASLDSEMLRIANDFTPAFGGALQSVLNAFASSLGNKGGFSGGWISALAGSITGGKTGAASGADAWAGLRLASGGRVHGPGTSTSDSSPAALSDGEFIVNAAATAKNLGLLHAINSGKAVQHRATGGPITPFLAGNVVPFNPASAQSPSLNVNIVNAHETAGVKVQERRGADGMPSLEVMIDKVAAKKLTTSGSSMNNAMRDGFGARPVMKRR